MPEKIKISYVCRECGYETGKWLGRCPSCGSFNTLERTETAVGAESRAPAEAKSQAIARAVVRTTVRTDLRSAAVPLGKIQPMAENRLSTGLSELDNVLSGGIVEGSLILLGGDPGIGKSTLLLQICQSIGEKGKNILYVSGEESLQQIKLRADRLGIFTERLFLIAETRIGAIEQILRETRPDLAIIDSIQTIYSEESAPAPGSVSQVRACTSILTRLAKTLGISVFIVGHVTKEGAIAGPRVLEHMVDTVLYFEGERHESYRLIRAVKNRFGATNEIGVFDMREQGLQPIDNPSEYMLSGRPLDAPGSVVTCSVEGTRPILTEVQALICATNFGTPRRTATGLDHNRVAMLLAVLEKRAGLHLSNYDSYVNIAGGLKIMEPALDAAVVAAAASSYRDKAVDPYMMAFGEVGLTGELRAVNMAEKRIAEAHKLGFKLCVIPRANLRGLHKPEGCRVLGAAHVNELLEAGLG
ncbi:MAG: DNA repair protein RadA [Clostridiales bacterium]|jgi:DNA repair protein RadA/Sms|nr:DNA repair protein RadA [Clostridiales bacterium]